VIYDLLYRRAPLTVDVGDDINDAPDDAAEYLQSLTASAPTESADPADEGTLSAPEPEDSAAPAKSDVPLQPPDAAPQDTHSRDSPA